MAEKGEAVPVEKLKNMRLVFGVFLEANGDMNIIVNDAYSREFQEKLVAHLHKSIGEFFNHYASSVTGARQ